jgi:hypothetical protein
VHNPFGTGTGAFDPTMVALMSQALDSAYEVLKAEAKLPRDDAALRSALAKLIIELTKEGELDPTCLAQLALKRFRQDQKSKVTTRSQRGHS